MSSTGCVTYLDRGSKVEFLPVKVSALPDDGMIGERIAQEVNIVTSNLTGEYVSILPLPTAQELKRVGSKLEGTTKIGDQAVLHGWLSRLPEQKRITQSQIR